MADVSAIFGILLVLGITFPGMLSAWWLLFPRSVQRAQVRIERTPWLCFGLGVLLSIFLAIPIFILVALPFGPAQLIGWSLAVLVLAISVLGAAGLAALMGNQIQRYMSTTGNDPSPAAAFLKGAIALELAAVFPVIGWFIVVPIAVITSLGATAFALLRWKPTAARKPVSIQNPDLSSVAHDTIST